MRGADGRDRAAGEEGSARREDHRLSAGAGVRLERYVEATGIDAVSIDWSVPVDYARERLQAHVAVQGNLDPMVLMAGGDALERAVRRIRTGLGGGRFIFNLGHGILPETPVENVRRLVELVRAQ